MRRLVGTGAIALIVGLAGCSGGGDKPAEALPPTATSSSDQGTVVPPPSSSSASPTATPSASPSTQPTKPTLPAVARQHSRAGAKAMAEYWLYALDYALGTGDAKPMWAVSKPNCHTCANYSDAVQTIIREGGSITPLHRTRILKANVVTYSSHTARVLTTYITGQSRNRIPKKHIDRRNAPPTRTEASIATTWNGSGWVVAEVYNP